jgi:hypothetical protein
MKGRYRPEVQVKQWVGEVQGEHGRFRVFRTGSDRHYLFILLDPSGCQTQIQVPVLRADLRDDVRSALAHGWGHA